MSSSDVADFFANKKKKKKTFKFNANKIDAGAVGSNASPPPQVDVSSTTISSLDADGGARTTASTAASLANLSLGSDTATTKVTSGGSGDGSATAVGEQWDDEALAAAITARKVVTASTITNTSTTTTSSSSTAATARLLDMKAFDSKRNEQEDIAEKLRVEETKDQLKAAREGMEREAQRIREEQERAAAAAADSASGSSGRFIPPHLRHVGMGLMRSRMGTSNALDVRNEELFPDLAKADAKLMEQKQQKKQQQPSTSTMGPKRTPVGGNATWASRPLVTAPKQPAATTTTAAAVVIEKVTNEVITAEDTSAATNTKADENTTTLTAPSEPSTTTKETLPEVVKQEEPTKDVDETAATPKEQVVETNRPEEAGEVKSEAAAAAAATKPKVKKKRKDVSTFKPSS